MMLLDFAGFGRGASCCLRTGPIAAHHHEQQPTGRIMKATGG